MSAEPIALVPGLAPAAPIMRVLSQFDRAKLETFAEVAIALLDLQDGDPDEEAEALEDDFTDMPAEVDFGPGCPIADPAEAEEDMGEEERGENRSWSNSIDQRRLSEGCFTFAAHDDDAEDDDPAGVCDEDGINTVPATPRWGFGPGCPIGDGEVTL